MIEIVMIEFFICKFLEYLRLIADYFNTNSNGEKRYFKLTAGSFVFLFDLSAFSVPTISFSPLFIIDIAVVGFLFYWVYKMIKGTKGMRILIGILILVVFLILSKFFQLYIFNWILRQLLAMVLVAIPIVFQPELRRSLEKLGHLKIISNKRWQKFQAEENIKPIIEASKILSKNKIGALMIIKEKTGLDDYIDLGVKIDGKLSKEMLLSIFSPPSPLHDGAVIIDGNKILAANCLLPFTESGQEFQLGGRHRAALGICSETDALGIVISEENGKISLAKEGRFFQNISFKKFEQILKQFYNLSLNRNNKRNKK